MKKIRIGIFLILALFVTNACHEKPKGDAQSIKKPPSDFQYVLDRFADLQIFRYRVPGFENLDVQNKKLAYYLYQAALCGRDIIYDQNYKHNLRIRKVLEAIYGNSLRSMQSGFGFPTVYTTITQQQKYFLISARNILPV